MSLRERVRNIFSVEEENKTAKRIGGFEIKETKNFITEMLKENSNDKGLVDFNDTSAELINGNGLIKDEEKKYIKKVPYNYNLYMLAYKQVPKVFRAVNTRAEFSVQSGYKLRGEEKDIEKIREWERKIHFDNSLIQLTKEEILFGNVFVKPVGAGLDTKLKFLPVTTMRLLRKPTGQLMGYIQVANNNVVARFEPDEIIHFKWNSIESEPYGVPEITPNIKVLETKITTENLIEPLIKYHLENRVIFKCGSPEKPYSTTQINNFKQALEDRKVGGDMMVPGDVSESVIQAGKGVGDLINLINHNESQLNTGIYFPQVLIDSSGGDDASASQISGLENNVKTIQDSLTKNIEMGFYTRVLGKEDVPQIIWNPMNIEIELRRARLLRQLVGTNNAPKIITQDEAREVLGLKELPEEEKDEPVEPSGGQFNPGQRGKEKEVPSMRKND